MTPHPPDDLDDERLVRYLSGETSPEETREIEQWIGESAERRRRIELLRRGWNAAARPPLRGDLERGWAAIASQLAELEASEAGEGRPPRVLRLVPPVAKRSRWAVAARAAAVLLAAGAGAQLVRMADDQVEADRAGAMREIVTKPGQRVEVYLSDGTHVVLGVASRLRFPATFGASRDVELDGQAYFDVAHDERRPFAVHTANAVARDLGTKFDVRAYGTTEDVAVVVEEGAVALAPAAARADSVILGPGSMGRVSPDGRLAPARAVEVDAYLAWTTGRLVFRQTPVAEAVAQLNRWYGADVRLGDSALARLALTATITEESLTQALDIIAGALDARLERRGSSVILYANHHVR